MGFRWLIVLVLALAGCLEPTYQQCGDQICPSELTCVGGARCVDPQLVSECSAMADGTPCTWSLGAPGHCAAGVCEQAVCGDDIVDASLHEDCDGSSSEQCIEYGFDMGLTSCTADCKIDVTTGCIHFGWQLTANAPTSAMWTDGTTLAYLTQSPFALHVTVAGADTEVDGFFYSVAGHGDLIVASTATGVVELQQGAMVSIPQPPTAPTTVAFDEAGTLYALDGCHVEIFDGTSWSVVWDGVSSGCSMLAFGDGRVFVASETQIFELINGSLVLQLTNQAYFFTGIVYADGGLWIATSTGLYRGIENMISSVFTGVPLIAVVVAGSKVYGATGGGTFTRWNGSRLTFGHVPTHGAFVSDGVGNVYVYGGPIYRYTGIDFGTLPAVTPSPSALVDPIVDVVRLDPGFGVAIRGEELYRDNGLSWNTHADPAAPASMYAIAATGKDDVVIETHIPDGTYAGLYRSTDATMDNFARVADPAGELYSPIWNGLWIADDHTVFAVGTNGWNGTGAAPTTPYFGVLATKWTLAMLSDPTCTPHAVHGIDSTNALAAGDCGGTGVIWQYTSGTWTELWRAPAMPFAAVHVTPDGWIFATGGSGTAWFDGSAWHTDPGLRGSSLSGLAGNDMWLAGYFTNVQHWDGMQWSQISTQPVDNMAVSATADDVMFVGGADGHVLLLRDH